MDESLVFFGSGPVAAKSLALLAKKFTIEAIITKPTTLAMMSTASNASVFAANNAKELDELIENQKFTSRLAVLVDFGIIVSQNVIDYFSLGIVNSHFSLLPQWRGADPISFALLSGQAETGVSLMLLVEKMDEGPLLALAPLAIAASDTGPSLTDKLINLSDQLLIKNLPKYASGQLAVQPQTSAGTSYSRKLTKADGLIHWAKPAEEIEREIRAYLDWPKSRAKLGQIEVIITEASVASEQLAPGEILANYNKLLVGTASEALEIIKLKPAGRQEMTAAEFIRGYDSRIS